MIGKKLNCYLNIDKGELKPKFYGARTARYFQVTPLRHQLDGLLKFVSKSIGLSLLIESARNVKHEQGEV